MFARFSNRIVTRCRLTAALSLGALLAGLAGGCASGPKSFQVPLEYKPSGSVGGATASAGKIPPDGIYIEVSDVRGRMEIGESRGKKSTTKVLATGKPQPSEFVTTVMENHFMGAGARVVDQQKRSGRVVQTELTQFWTQKKGKIDATVEALVTVKDRNGTPLYQNKIAGVAQAGGGLSVGRLQSLYSDATVRFVRNLLNDAEFRRSLGRNATALNAPAKKSEEAPGADAPTADVSGETGMEQ
jgi:hypothetical protein